MRKSDCQASNGRSEASGLARRLLFSPTSASLASASFPFDLSPPAYSGSQLAAGTISAMESLSDVTPYKYEPLVEDKAIRLMTLFPGQFHDDIIIDISTQILSESHQPVYEALSYVCGDPQKDFAVFVKYSNNRSSHASPSVEEDLQFLRIAEEASSTSTSSTISERWIRESCRRLPIGKNLDEALRYLRRVDEKRTLWVDAICIHQDNLEERGRQVRRMAQIYSLTSRVNIWLGLEENDSSYAIDIVCELGTMADDEGILQGPVKLQDIEVDERNTILYTTRSFFAIHRLVDREWFQRLWIRQEAYLGREAAIILCGHASQSWLEFGTGLRAMTKNSWNIPMGWEPKYRHMFMASLIRVVEIVSIGDAGHIEGLLTMAREANCFDPRDRVFAILGMAKPIDQDVADGVAPDYTMTFEDIFANLFEKITNRSKSLLLLIYCETARDSTYRPTWSPDWSTPRSGFLHEAEYADASSAISAWRIDRLRLRSEGYVAAIVRTSKSTMFSKTGGSLEQWEAFRDHLGTLNSDDDLLNAYADVAMKGTYCENYVQPDYRNCCPLEAAKLVVESVANGESFKGTYNSRNCDNFFKTALCNLAGRAWIMTDQGHIGFAPSSVQPGDSICVLLGCPTLMALTPRSDGGRRVLGPCYVQGLSQGEALLGPIPADMKLVWERANIRLGRWRFQDIHTKDLTMLDPRVDWSELKVEEGDDRIRYIVNDEDSGQSEYYRRPDAEYFRNHGVNIEEFILI